MGAISPFIEEHPVPQPSSSRHSPHRAHRGVADGPLETWATGRLLSTAARLVEHAWDAHLGRWHLNHASFAVLWMLETGPRTQRQLATTATVQAQTMSRVLDRLERLGYVQRVRSESDRRRVLVSLTPAGRRARAAAHDEGIAEGLVGDGVPDLDQLRAALVQLVRHLRPDAGARPDDASPGPA